MSAMSAIPTSPKTPDYMYDPELPLYACFDWVEGPCFTAFRVEDKDDKLFTPQIQSQLFATHTGRLPVIGDLEEDLTLERTEIIVNSKKMDVCCNEKLLIACLELGYTHIFDIISRTEINPTTFNAERFYCVRGAIAPDWKTINGDLQTVHI